MSSSLSRTDLVAIVTTAVGGLGAGTMLVSGAPAIVVSAGGSTTLAGAVAAVFMAATLVAQLATVKLVRLVGFPFALVLSVVLLGVPCLIGLFHIAPSSWLLISALRGAGFGIIAIIATALPPMLAPTKIIGRVVGIQGFAMALAQTIVLPGSVALLEAFGTPVVLIAAAVLPLIGLAAYPALRRHRTYGPTDAYRFVPRREGRGLLVVACAVLGGAAAAYGAVTTLVPIGPYHSPALVLFALSVSLTVGRLLAGVGVDRWGAGRSLRWAVLLAAAGTALFAWPSHDSFAFVLGGAVLYGCAFGIVQNDTMLLCYSACGPGGITAASLWWNLSIDAAAGAGALGFAALVGVAGFSGTFLIGATSVAACALLPIARSRRLIGFESDGSVGVRESAGAVTQVRDESDDRDIGLRANRHT